MTLVHRVLSPKPVPTLGDYTRRFGGGAGLRKAHSESAESVIEVLADAGLRGRGGAGFPTARKWRTVLENASASKPTTVIVNAAEGEPGTFKDRTILRCNPYQVIEGALVAAHVLDASTIIIALKRSFPADVARVRSAISEVREAGWDDGVDLVVFEGPDEYLYGEETALLETLEGRLPFPRIAPPFRRGMSGLVQGGEGEEATGLAARVQMAGADDASQAPPALIDNVETLANIPKILDRGAAWFRTEGTDESPGTIVCTITGQVRRPGVGEVLMGTTLREAIEEIGGGARAGATITAVMPGVSNAIVPAHLLDTPLTYEAMAAIGSGLGSGGYWVLDDSVDPVAAVAGVSRFLAIESCGQCSPCKQDGLVLADLLEELAASRVTREDVDELRRRATTVATGARCSLGIQHQDIVAGLLTYFAPEVAAHRHKSAAGTQVIAVAELVDISESAVQIDDRHQHKQPDWTYTPTWGGESPVERFIDHRAHEELES
ncbi:NADH-ubiquinone oxidoreductase-F iron-sulfur binding region domain-containing protein [Aquihabitans daechungensis]|uniref:NADH-ubiquinone oxidoreductase-F iron-sulfur binding region domain-containing protein n=1 Tax=Aquihabitans daechungensis TaxID=1052257 RepID=UPI003BA30096